MVDVDELRGIIAKRGKSQADVAKAIGIAPKTFYSKMKCGVFNTLEIDVISDYLEIKEPWRIFFAK